LVCANIANDLKIRLSLYSFLFLKKFNKFKKTRSFVIYYRVFLCYHMFDKRTSQSLFKHFGSTSEICRERKGMYKTKNNHENNSFLKRFSDTEGSLDGVAVNSEKENDTASSSESEQNNDVSVKAVRNTAHDSENDQQAREKAPSSADVTKESHLLWSLLDMDDEIKFDIDGVKNTARELFANNLLRSWEDQCRKLSEKYPDFDIRREVKNKTFLALLRCGITLDVAYKAINYDSVLKSDVNKAMELFYSDLRARGARPAENGLISGGGISIGQGARSFSRKERADIAKRVEKGEKIIL